MQTNKKKYNKLKLIICSALAFIVGAFTLATLPQRNYVALAEEVPQEEVIENTVDFVNSDLITIMEYGVANGDLVLYDYFSNNFVFDEPMIFYNFNSNDLEDGYKILKWSLYCYYYNSNNELINTTSSFSCIGYSSNNVNSLKLSNIYPANNVNYGNVNEVSAYDVGFDFATDYSVFWTDSGYNGLIGSIFNFNSNYYNYFQLLNDGVDVSSLSVGSGFWVSYNSSGTTKGLNATALKNTDIYSCLDLNFVRLSDLLVYSYTNGYDVGYTNGYDVGYDDGYDVGSQNGTGDGYDDGYNDGYNEGFSDGFSDGNVLTNEYLQFGVFANCEQEFVFEYYTDLLVDPPYEEYIQLGKDYSPYLVDKGLSFKKINNINISLYNTVRISDYQIRPPSLYPNDSGNVFYYFENFETTIFINIPTNYSEPFIQFTGTYLDNLYDISITFRNEYGFRRTLLGSLDEYGMLWVKDEVNNALVGFNGTLEEIYFKCGNFNSRNPVSPVSVLQDLVIFDTSKRNHLPSYSAGYNQGYQDGFDFGVDEGYDDGFDDGYSQGEKDGYAEGVNTQGGLFQSFFGSIIDVPLKTFYGLFNIDIFGINLSAFLLSLFSICMIVALIRFFV